MNDVGNSIFKKDKTSNQYLSNLRVEGLRQIAQYAFSTSLSEHTHCAQ